jgi:hypothetical protein
MKRIFVLLLAVAALAAAAELPVKQVVLYKHGVGFFERSGKLGPGESARLDFNASEMNDVLKSLTIEERGGGKISGLRYDSMDPLGHKLAEFPVPDRRRAAAQRHAGPAQGRAPGIEVRERDGGRRHRQRPPGGG